MEQTLTYRIIDDTVLDTLDPPRRSYWVTVAILFGGVQPGEPIDRGSAGVSGDGLSEYQAGGDLFEEGGTDCLISALKRVVYMPDRRKKITIINTQIPNKSQ